MTDKGSHDASYSGRLSYLIRTSILPSCFLAVVTSTGYNDHSIPLGNSGGSNCTWIEGPTAFRNLDTWKTGWIEQLGGNAS